MTIHATYSILRDRQKLKYLLGSCLALLVVANITLDYLFTVFRGSSFYLSESLLFSSYWVIYLPLLPLLLQFTQRTEKPRLKLALAGAAIAMHLLMYPALVGLLSAMFYDHTFSYRQTFHFGLSAYCIKSVLIYGFSLLAFNFLNKRDNPSPAISETKEKKPSKSFIKAIVVTDHNNIRSVLAVNDISYISANPPYVSIHHLSKKYLHNETLRSLADRLDERQFVRIHKSHIVNLQKIISYQSRQNGDYDITLFDGAVVRVSRNYAKDFKSKMEQYTQPGAE